MKNRQIITTPSSFAVDESFEDPRFMKVRIDVLESDVEARGHGIRFTRESLEKSKDSFANIPILANVITKTDEDGNETLDYGGHDFHIENDKFNDGEGKMIYEEAVVGIVPETCELEIKDNKEGNAVLALNAFLYKDYGNYCCDILEERGGQTAVSAELDCGDISYNEQDNINEVGIFTACGITLLGEDFDPAIPNAKAVMFSSKEDDRQTQLMSIMQELKESLDKYTNAVSSAQNLERKEEAKIMNHFEELLAKYNLTAEEITFDYANMSDDELDAAFEALSNTKSKDSLEEKQETPPVAENTVELSVKIGENTINLSKSLTEVIYALTDLVNTTYAADGDYYQTDVFDEGSVKSKYVIMYGVYSGKAYKQSWNLKDGSYVLKGGREEVFAEWVTADERDQLNSMRSNLTALQAEVDECKATLAKYESEPEKMEILQSDVYAQLSENPEYQELLDNHFDVTKEDLSAKLDQILLAQVKANVKVGLSINENTKGVKTFPVGENTNSGRYGGMFAN